MTLKFRNRLLMIFLSCSIACIAAALALLIVAFIKKEIIPPSGDRILTIAKQLPILPYSFTATMLSICVLVLYVPLTTSFLIASFEKTQSTEVLFFAGFLAACLCEGVRLIIPLFGLWKTFSSLLIFCGRIVLLGRFLAPLSFLCAAIMSDTTQRQDVERNSTIVYALCIVFAVIMPLDTARIDSTCAVFWGYSKIFFTVRILLILCTFISFFINSQKRESPELKNIALLYLVIMAGYGLLISSDNYIFFILGTLFLLAGTAPFIYTIHQLYLWK